MESPTFGQWLRRARTTHNPRLSQDRLSELTGIERSYLSKMENGRVGLPLSETRARLHVALGTSDDDLRSFGVAVREDYESSTPDDHRYPPPRSVAIFEDRPGYAENRANPFDRSDPRYAYVETLKRFDLSRREHAGLLVAVAQLLQLIDAPPETFALMADVIPRDDAR